MHIFLIGGGSNGRAGKPNDLEPIDKLIVDSTNKSNPNFLFIGLASSYADSYYDLMKKNYRSLGANPVYLKKKNILNNPDIVINKIKEADIIYLAGGDTTKLVREAKKYGIDKLLKEKINSDTVIVGISAGAISLCNDGLSDYKIINNEGDNYSFTDGFSFINISLCPHGQEEKRINDLKNELVNNKKVLVLDNNTSLEIKDNLCKVHKTDNNSKIRLISKNNNKITEIELNDTFNIDTITN